MKLRKHVKEELIAKHNATSPREDEDLADQPEDSGAQQCSDDLDSERLAAVGIKDAQALSRVLNAIHRDPSILQLCSQFAKQWSDQTCGSTVALMRKLHTPLRSLLARLWDSALAEDCSEFRAC